MMTHRADPDTIARLAKEAYGWFTTTKRGDETIHVLKDGRPQRVVDLAHAAHGDMMPDDWRYEFIGEALEYLADGNDADEYNPEPDVYTSDLLRWLSSRLDRSGYCDDAAEEYGTTDASMTDRIGLGQMFEKRETFGQVLDALNDRAAEVDDEEDEDEDTEDEGSAGEAKS